MKRNGRFKRLRLLLDTHIILWSVAEPERLSHRILNELSNPDSELWSLRSVYGKSWCWRKRSVFCSRETGQKQCVTSSRKPLSRKRPLPVKWQSRGRMVDLPHQDPADRFLTATALVYNLTLVTADKRIIEAGSVPILSAL